MTHGVADQVVGDLQRYGLGALRRGLEAFPEREEPVDTSYYFEGFGMDGRR